MVIREEGYAYRRLSLILDREGRPVPALDPQGFPSHARPSCARVRIAVFWATCFAQFPRLFFGKYVLYGKAEFGDLGFDFSQRACCFDFTSRSNLTLQFRSLRQKFFVVQSKSFFNAYFIITAQTYIEC